jgi:hypothetical protein
VVEVQVVTEQEEELFKVAAVVAAVVGDHLLLFQVQHQQMVQQL